MQNLQILRRRIRSVQNTQKITQAMQMVAGAKLRRSQGELVSFRPYAQRLEAITRRFLQAHPSLRHPLLEQGKEGAPLGLILISSDTGLCGTYNERVLGVAQQFLLENPSAVIVTIGKKGTRTLIRRGIHRAKEVLDWGGRYEPAKADPVARWILELFFNGTVCCWWIASMQFISALRWKPTVEQFIPTVRPASEEVPEKIIVEPDLERVSDDLLRRFNAAQFRRVVLEAFTSEHSARMIAMKNATDNAAEMIEHLTLVRNKARQAAITKELIEVVSGAQALT